MIADACPECGATPALGASCRDLFHALLLLEAEVSGAPGGLPHFYAVASYNLQHPISGGLHREALRGLRSAVADALEGRASIEDLRRRARAGAKRLGRVTRRAGDDVPASFPGDWAVTITEILAGGVEGYAGRVEAWARSVLRELDRAGRGAG